MRDREISKKALGFVIGSMSSRKNRLGIRGELGKEELHKKRNLDA
jgi:hypothetical protein